MKEITFAILGMGNRGMVYAKELLKYPHEARITAVANRSAGRLEKARELIKLPPERCFSGADALFAQPRLADVMVICTQDAQHKEHAIAAMERGYHLLLEKPVSTDPSECREIAETAKRLNRKVVVGFVMRHTVFYRMVKDLIEEGAIGNVVNIQASQPMGNFNFAHAYVRGNWHNTKVASPMILTHCCHDLDLLLWLAGKRPISVSSVGGVAHFRKENCPEGAPARCTDGCKADCLYHAEKFYLSRLPGRPTSLLHPDPTPENILEVLRTTDYGRCVYQLDNDAADHQVVNMLLEDGVTVDFSVSAFSHKQDRSLHVMGTKGHIWGNFRDKKLFVGVFGKEPYEIDLSDADYTGHGGGDGGIVRDMVAMFRSEDADVALVEDAVYSHYVAFAAEESRLQNGRVMPIEL